MGVILECMIPMNKGVGGSMNNDLMKSILGNSQELNDKVSLNSGMSLPEKTEAVKKMLEEAGKTVGLVSGRIQHFVSFMLERFTPGTYTSNFAHEWAIRFGDGNEWEFADPRGRAILEGLFPELYLKEEGENMDDEETSSVPPETLMRRRRVRSINKEHEGEQADRARYESVEENQADICVMRKRIQELADVDGSLLSGIYKHYIGEDVPGELDETKKKVQSFLADSASEEQLQEIWAKFVHYGTEFDESRQGSGSNESGKKVNEEEDKLSPGEQELQAASGMVEDVTADIQRAAKYVKAGNTKSALSSIKLVMEDLKSALTILKTLSNGLKAVKDSNESTGKKVNEANFDAADELQYILETIEEELYKANKILREAVPGSLTYERAIRYWIPHIKGALGIGEFHGSMFTMANTIKELRGEGEGESLLDMPEVEDYSDDEDENESKVVDKRIKEDADKVHNRFGNLYNEVEEWIGGKPYSIQDVAWGMAMVDQDDAIIRLFNQLREEGSTHESKKVNEQDDIPVKRTKKKPWEEEETEEEEEEEQENIPPEPTPDEEMPDEEIPAEEEEAPEEETVPTGPTRSGQEPITSDQPDVTTKTTDVPPEETAPEIDKEYVGRKGDDFYYLTQETSDTGEPVDLVVQDQVGEKVFSAKEHNLDTSDVGEFVTAAAEELEITDISTSLVQKYIIARKEQEMEQEQEKEIASEEEEPFELSSDSLGKSKYEGIVKFGNKKYSYQIYEEADKALVIIGETKFFFTKSSVDLYEDKEKLCVDVLSSMGEKVVKEIVEFREIEYSMTIPWKKLPVIPVQQLGRRMKHELIVAVNTSNLTENLAKPLRRLAKSFESKLNPADLDKVVDQLYVYADENDIQIKVK